MSDYLDTIDIVDSPHMPHGDLEWEEAAFTPVSPTQDPRSLEGTGHAKWWLRILLALSVLALVGRLGWLQLGQGSEMRALADGNRLRERVLLAPRGEILDRNGEVLARSAPSFRLLVVPFDVPKGQFSDRLAELAKALSLDTAALTESTKSLDQKSVQPVTLVSNLSKNQAVLFETRSVEFPGFLVQAVPVREYTSPFAFAHVLGITGSIGDSDDYLKNPLYSPQDVVGKNGLEYSYESVLKGANGHDLVEVDAAGSVVKSLGQLPSSPGATFHSTLDKGLQEVLYAQYADKPYMKGAAVALDPKTGAVLALVSFPSFDGNAFAQGMSTAAYQALLSNTQLPLFNRVIGAQLPPGSTVKPMVGIAALQEGVVTDRTIIYDKGKITVPNQFNPAISYDFVGWKRTGLGPMTVRSAIASSSDIYFYVVGGGYPGSGVDGLGIEKLSSYYRKFNLGKPTGIDLPGEKPGVVADPAWKESFFKSDPILGKWYLGDTYHVSIGQGDMLTTPLQVAEWTATIANNGVGMKPHVLDRAEDQSGATVAEFKPEVLIPKVADDNVISIVQQGMRQTVLAGSAQQLQSLPITSAGKTGTAQFDNNASEHAWFTSYAPYEDPQIVLTVLVEGGGEGHAVAGPIAREVLKWWAEHRYKSSGK